MLPADYELESPQAKAWPLIPQDVYQCEVTKIEHKLEPNRWKKEATDLDEKRVMVFEFTIIEEGAHYGRKLWQKMAPVKPYPPQSGGKESWVYRLASAMEGHSITRGEADKFGSSNINDYIHRQVRVTVKHSAPNAQGKQYSNVESFLGAKTQLPPFDEKKVPKENQAEPKEGKSFRDVVSTHVPHIVPPSDDPTNGEPNLMVNDAKPHEDIGVEDIPF